MKFLKTLTLLLLIACIIMGGVVFGFFDSFLGGSNSAEVDNTPVEQTTTEPIAKYQTFVVYRAPADNSEYLVAEHYKIKDNGKTVMENALNALINTPPKIANCTNVFPKGTKVLGLEIKNGTAIVNFNRAFQKRGQGSYNAMMMVGSVVNTLTEFPEIKRVIFHSEGKEIAVLGGHIDLIDPVERNTTLLKK
jgi:spore germination protein GerM